MAATPPSLNGSSPVAGATPAPVIGQGPTTSPAVDPQSPLEQGSGIAPEQGNALSDDTPPPPTPLDPTDESNTDSSFLGDETVLYKKLLARGKRRPWDIKLNDAQHDAIVTHVLRDFEDADYGNQNFKRNMTDMYANWRGNVEPKDFPFDGCANITVPLTSVLIETMKARIRKAIFGGEFLCKMSYVDKQVPNDELNELNQWFKWELDEIVEIDKWADAWLHNILVFGIDITFASYMHESRLLHSFKKWELDEAKTLTDHLLAGIEDIINQPSTWGDESPLAVDKQTSPGKFSLTDGGRIEFSITDDNELRADIWRKETIFNGVRLNQVQLEDLVVSNTNPDIEKIPFLGIRQWYTSADYRQALDDKYFIDYGSEENQRIIATFDYTKIAELISQQQTELADSQTGTDSRDTSASNSSHRYGEVYRWEGWWSWDDSGDDYTIDKALDPATQIAVWVGVRSKKIFKIARLEDLNKDGKRSGVKTGFIEEPNRFFPMGLAEWIRHSQTELDAVHNQRLDAGLLYNIPFGFYKPTSGIGKDAQPLKMEPGKFFPSADPQGVNCPRTNWVPTVSFAEEQGIVRYANLQAGLTDPATGQVSSKRQSASEYVGNANAIDTRSEDVIRGIVYSLRMLLQRVRSLYEQYGPRVRMFRVGGEGGAKLTKSFEMDRLGGRMTLDMTSNLQQLNDQLQRQTALDMLQLLLNQLLIQAGIVDPLTIYQAIKEVARLSHYENVTIHRPNVPPISDPPDVEERQMFANQKPTGPTLGENVSEHMQHHAMTMADSELMSKWTPAARKQMQDHIQATLKMGQAQDLIKQQQAIQATQMQMQMEQKGIRPGQAGAQKPQGNTGAGTAAEGVRGQGQGGSATPPTPAAQ